MVHYTPLGTLLVAADPSDRDADRPAPALPARVSTSAPDDSRRQSAEQPNRSCAAGVCGGAELGDDHQVDNRAVAVALEAACAASGVSMVRDEVGPVSRRGRHGLTGVSLRSGESAHGPHRRAVRREPLGRGRRTARGPPTTGPPGEGAHPPARRRRRPAAPSRPCAASSTVGRATWSRGPTAPSSWARPSRRRASI